MGAARIMTSRASGFPATKGMTDANARLGRRHCFEIGERRLLNRFLDDARLLIRRGDIRVTVNGRIYSPV